MLSPNLDVLKFFLRAIFFSPRIVVLRYILNDSLSLCTAFPSSVKAYKCCLYLISGTKTQQRHSFQKAILKAIHKRGKKRDLSRTYTRSCQTPRHHNLSILITQYDTMQSLSIHNRRSDPHPPFHLMLHILLRILDTNALYICQMIVLNV